MKKSLFFIKKIKNFLIHKNFLNLKKLYILSVSGGQDSTALFFFFFIIKKQFSIKMHIFHCNHLWQYDNFFYSIQLKQICFLLKIDYSQAIPKKSLYNEKQARFWRLTMFYRICFFFKSFFLLTAHSSTDRIETFFLNLFRGSGLMGLNSFNKTRKLFNVKENFFFSSNNFLVLKSEKKVFNYLKQKKGFKQNKISTKSFLIDELKTQKANLIKPFFLVSRNELKLFLKILKLPIFPDKTNRMFIYKRNRLRKQILPLLKVYFNKQINNTIIKIIEILSHNEKEFINEFVPLYKKIFFIHKNFYCVNGDFFKILSYEKQKKFIFLFLKTKKKEKISFFLIRKLVWLIKNFNNKNFCYYETFIIPKIGFMYKYKNYIYFIK